MCVNEHSVHEMFVKMLVYVCKTVHEMAVVIRAKAHLGRRGAAQNLATWSLVGGFCSIASGYTYTWALLEAPCCSRLDCPTHYR